MFDRYFSSVAAEFIDSPFKMPFKKLASSFFLFLLRVDISRRSEIFNLLIRPIIAAISHEYRVVKRAGVPISSVYRECNKV